MRAWILLLPFLLLNCAERPPAPDNSLSNQTREEYEALIAADTFPTNHYVGLYQTFQADMTILTTEVRTASLIQRKAFMQWNDKEYQMEHEKAVQENAAYAKFFLRYFSPEHDYDDLNKPKTIWKVYLDVSGQRLEGKVKKMTDKYVEIKTLYPNMDRFSTPYEVTFNVPMATVQNGPCKVTLTSSLGTAEFAFPVKK